MKTQTDDSTPGTSGPNGKGSGALAAATSEPQPKVKDKCRHLQMVGHPGKSRERLIADVVTQGLASNAWTAMRYMKPEFGDISLTDMVASLRASGDAVNRGDMASAERMLYAQTIALNAMFGEMARVASCNVFKSPEWADRYMRLALKAQSQSRATVETLVALKNPPVVFTKQANFAAGHQQVNNGPPAADGSNRTSTRAGSRAGESELRQSKQLEAPDGQWLDTGTKSAPGGVDSHLAPVGQVNGTPQRRGEGGRCSQPLEGRDSRVASGLRS